MKCSPSPRTNESPVASRVPTLTALSVQVRLVTPTASAVATSTVTPATRSLDAMLNQPNPVGNSAVVMSTVGSVVSRTRTVKLSESLMPPLSVTEQLTVVSPIGKASPELWLHVGVGSGLSSASVAVTEKVTTALEGDVASAMTGLAGTVSTGAVLLTWAVNWNT